MLADTLALRLAVGSADLSGCAGQVQRGDMRGLVHARLPEGPLTPPPLPRGPRGRGEGTFREFIHVARHASKVVRGGKLRSPAASVPRGTTAEPACGLLVSAG